MTTERDKFLTEAMGECWHEWKWIPGDGRSCKNCDIDLYGRDNPTYSQIVETPENPDFSTWVGFGKLWEWAIDQEWFHLFLMVDNKSGPVDVIHPDRFATAVYEYLKER